MAEQAFSDFTLEDAAEALSYIDAHDRETWTEMARAIKSEFPGDDGFDVWDQWSQTASNYNEKSARTVWKSFKSVGGTTIATLIGRAKEHGYSQKRRASLTPAQIAAKRQAVEAQSIAHQQRQLEQHQARADVAVSIWNQARPATEHPYLQRKGIKPASAHEARVADSIPRSVFFGEGADGELQNVLLLPAADFSGDKPKIMSLQAILPTGEKFNMGGAKSNGCCGRLIGQDKTAIVIAEGYATAKAINRVTKYDVLYCFSAANVRNVARVVRSKKPDTPIILAADNDWQNELDGKRNAGVSFASEAAAEIRGHVVFPIFDGTNPQHTDWDDWLRNGYGDEAWMVEIFQQAITQPAVQQPEPPAPAQSPANDNDPITAMISEWAFVASQRKFIHVPTMRMVDVDAFNLQYIHLMASIPKAEKMKPANYVRQVINGKVVHDLMYLPTAWNGDPFFTVDGVDYLNTYNTKSVPEVANDWQQHDAWQICLDHLKNIMPNDWEQLLFWMAHNVQHPGRKILWAPVIVGMPGDGKTTIAKMISAAIGYKHTKVVGPEALNSDFNGWAEGSCVTTFEEIRAKGHSRHDFMNKLKPLITNEVVDIVSKGKNSRNVANTQNYLALSNYRDALVLDSDDRRWGVFFTRFLSRSQVEREMDEVYWSRLNDYAIRDNPGVIRGWLLNVDLSSFNPNRGPGMTEAKRFMIMNSLSSDAQSVAEVIGAGSYGVNSTVVETKSLNSALREYEGRSMQTSRLSAALKELGFTKVEKTIKWNGRPCWIWTRSPFVYDDSVECRERIRLALEEHKSKAEFVPPWLNTN